MPAPSIAALPLDLVMESGYQIRFTALDAATGNAVAGVRVTDVAFQVRPVNIGADVGGVFGDEFPLLVPVTESV